MVRIKTLTETAWFILAAVSLISSLGCGPRPYSSSQFVGIWRAEYKDKDGYPISGTYGRIVTGSETITFRSDGKYRQVFEDGHGYVYTGTWNSWGLRDEEEFLNDSGSPKSFTPRAAPARYSSVVYLQGGRFYLDGVKRVEEDAQKPRGKHFFQKYFDRWLDVDIRDSILFPRDNSKAKGGLELESPAVGDPDAPQYITFSKIDDASPTTTPSD